MDIFKKLFKTNQVNGELADKYKQVFNGPLGKEVLDDLLKFCKVNQPTYTPGQPDNTAFNEGLRRVGLRLLSMVESEKDNKAKPKKDLTTPFV